MPLSLWLRNDFVIITKSVTCAGTNLYCRLKYFSGKSRDNCPVPKEDLTLGMKKEVFLLPQDDSLWNNKWLFERHVFDKQSCNSDSPYVEL